MLHYALCTQDTIASRENNSRSALTHAYFWIWSPVGYWSCAVRLIPVVHCYCSEHSSAVGVLPLRAASVPIVQDHSKHMPKVWVANNQFTCGRSYFARKSWITDQILSSMKSPPHKSYYCLICTMHVMPYSYQYTCITLNTTCRTLMIQWCTLSLLYQYIYTSLYHNY